MAVGLAMTMNGIHSGIWTIDFVLSPLEVCILGSDNPTLHSLRAYMVKPISLGEMGEN